MYESNLSEYLIIYHYFGVTGKRSNMDTLFVSLGEN